MAEIGFTSLPSDPEPGLKAWILGHLTRLRDRMRHDAVSSDEHLRTAVEEAEQKMRDARDALGSRQDF